MVRRHGGHTEAARLLIEKEADIGLKGQGGTMALDVALAHIDWTNPKREKVDWDELLKHAEGDATDGKADESALRGMKLFERDDE